MFKNMDVSAIGIILNHAYRMIRTLGQVGQDVEGSGYKTDNIIQYRMWSTDIVQQAGLLKC